MAQTIQIRRGTGSAVPSSLLDGELAINLDLGQLYYGSGSTVLNDFRFKNLTAENYTVSSSVTHYTFQALSGSTDFGDDSADIHKRTGSLNVSGALSMDGDIELSNNDKIFVGSSGTEIIANNDDYWKINANGVEAARFSSAGVTINEGGQAPVDFRVESDNDTHLLFVDAGANKMAIGTNTVSDSLLTVDGDVKVTNITASGNISASADIYTTLVFVDNVQSLGISGDDATLFGGHGSNKILLGKGNQTPSIFTNGSITASGNISSSGTVTANSLVGTLATAAQPNITSVGTLGSLTVTGNITANGNIVGDDGTSITNIAQIDLDNLYFDGDGATGLELGGSDIHAVNSDGNTLLRLQNSLIEIGSSDATITNGIKLAYNVTASGNISASGTIYANRYYSNGQLALNNINSAITLGYDNTYPINIGKSANPIKLHGHVTASGNISASGLNHTFGGNVTIIKSGSNGDAVLTLEADTGNDDENANPYIHFKQDGGGIEGMIGLTGDAGTWPDGTTLTGATGNAMVIGMTGSASSTNRQLFLAAGNTIGLAILNDGKVGIGVTDPDEALEVSGDIKLSGDIHANGNIIGDGATQITGIDKIAGTTDDILEITSDSDIIYKTDDDGDELGEHIFKERTTTLLTLAQASASFAVPVKDGGRTIVKILPTDFVANDGGRPMMIEDDNIGSNELFLHSFGSFESYVYIEIPYGMTATHVKIFGSNTGENFTVFEANITNKTIAAKCSATAIESEADITDVPWTDSNYLVILVTSAGATDEIHGGYVKIEPS